MKMCRLQLFLSKDWEVCQNFAPAGRIHSFPGNKTNTQISHYFMFLAIHSCLLNDPLPPNHSRKKCEVISVYFLPSLRTADHPQERKSPPLDAWDDFPLFPAGDRISLVLLCSTMVFHHGRKKWLFQLMTWKEYWVILGEFIVCKAMLMHDSPL